MAGTHINYRTSGVFIISATPFDDTQSIDYSSLDSLLEFYIEKEVTGITILGMMGEAHKLTPEETRQLVSHVLKRIDGRLPILVGVSNPDKDTLIDLSAFCMDGGAAGVMVAPYAALDSDDKIYRYYADILSSLETGTPVCYQDFPLGTDAPVSVACLERLFSEFSNLVMLKHEDWPGLAKISELRSGHDQGLSPEMSILVGNGGLYLPQELARGANGAMTGFAYPEMLVKVVKIFSEGDRERAEDIFDAYLPLIRYEQQPNFGLAVRKEVLRRRGVIKSARVRDPGPQLSSIDHEELSHLMQRVEANIKGLS